MRNIVFFVAILAILLFFFFEMYRERKVRAVNSILTDSVESLSTQVNVLQGEKFYLSALNDVDLASPSPFSGNNVKAYRLSEGKKSEPSTLGSILSPSKKNLIIRYTEIGCNACIDSTFKVIRNAKNLAGKFNIVILVDFSNYDYYVKWKKIAEVEDEVFWVRKGDLPFAAESGNESYLFVADHNYAGEFFVPNSMYVSYLINYINMLNKKV